jgi:hypothetical protein
MTGGLGYAGFTNSDGTGGGGGGDTFQEVLINGSILTQNNTVDATGYVLNFKSDYFSVIAQDEGNGFNFDGENTQVNFNKNADVNFTATIFDFFAHDTDPVYLCLNPLDSYINFDAADNGAGATGYGFRDNAGTMQFKNLSGDWGNFASGGLTGWDDMLSVGQVQTEARTIDAGGFDLLLTNADIFTGEANEFTFRTSNGDLDGYIDRLNIDGSADKGDFNFLNVNTFNVGNSDNDITASFMGNVGIGTSSPDESLHVVGDMIIENTLNPTLYFKSQSIDDGGVIEFSDVNDVMQFQIIASSGGDNRVLASLGNLIIGTEDSISSLILQTNNIYRLSISEDGFVGINKTIATEALDVVGNFKLTGNTIDFINQDSALSALTADKYGNLNLYGDTNEDGTLVEKTLSIDLDGITDFKSTNLAADAYLSRLTIGGNLDEPDVSIKNSHLWLDLTTQIPSSDLLVIQNDASNDRRVGQVATSDSAGINNFPNPNESQLAYNSELHTYCFYNGTEWRQISNTTM